MCTSFGHMLHRLCPVNVNSSMCMRHAHGSWRTTKQKMPEQTPQILLNLKLVRWLVLGW